MEKKAKNFLKICMNEYENTHIPHLGVPDFWMRLQNLTSSFTLNFIQPVKVYKGDAISQLISVSLRASSLTFLSLVMSSHLISYATAGTHKTTTLAEQSPDPVANFTRTHIYRGRQDIFCRNNLQLDQLSYPADHINTRACLRKT